jgi:hypothetical protein
MIYVADYTAARKYILVIKNYDLNNIPGIKV